MRFFYSGFFIKQLLLVPPDTPRKDFDFFRIFEELFCVHNQLPGVFIAGESITNQYNSTKIRKNSKLFRGMPIGTRRSWLMKKTGDEKSRDTVPFCFVHQHFRFRPKNQLPAIRDRLNNFFYRLPPGIYCNSGRMWEWEDFSGRKTVNIFYYKL